MRCAEIIAELEKKYPRSMAAEWDNPGLIAGRGEKEVKRIYIALDATEAIIEEACRKQVDMLITHHPMLFAAIRQINTDDFVGRRLIKLIQSDISYYAMHTNHDVVTMAPLSAELMQMKAPEVLEVTCEGDNGKEGFGRVGSLPKPMTLRECGEYVKGIFGLETVKIFGNPEQQVERAAISPGSGKSMIASSIEAAADVLISGDINHHEGIDAMMQGIAIIDAGHYGLEHIFIQQMAAFIQKKLPELEVICEEIRNPFHVV